jgi:hypothetical protein
MAPYKAFSDLVALSKYALGWRTPSGIRRGRDGEGWICAQPFTVDSSPAQRVAHLACLGCHRSGRAEIPTGAGCDWRLRIGVVEVPPSPPARVQFRPMGVRQRLCRPWGATASRRPDGNRVPAHRDVSLYPRPVTLAIPRAIRAGRLPYTRRCGLGSRLNADHAAPRLSVRAAAKAPNDRYEHECPRKPRPRAPSARGGARRGGYPSGLE